MKNAIHTLLAIAQKELLDHLRNGWTLAVAIAFALFALLISFAGFGFTGQIGLGEEQSTLFSLISLSIYLVPLLGLLLAYDAIAGEADRGTLDLLRTYPFNAVLLVYGKWLGHVATLLLALFLGLLVPAVISIVKGYQLSSWLLLLLSAAWMGAVFISLASLFSVLVWDRSRLIAINIVMWLFLAVLFDIGIIGLLVYSEGDLPQHIVSGLFFFNPTSLFRLLSMDLLLDPVMIAQLGLADQMPSRVAMISTLLLWTLLPLFIAAWRMSRLNR